MVDNALNEWHRLLADVHALLDRAQPHVEERESKTCAMLAPFREELSKTLQALQVHKHQAIFDPLIQSNGPAAAIARQLKVECIALGNDYQHYVRIWSAANIDAHWAEYRLAALAMMQRLRDGLTEQLAAIARLHQVPAESATTA